MLLQYWKAHSQECRLFLTVWLIYLFNIAPITGANENRYLDLVRAMVEEGRFEIDTYQYNTIDKSYYNGHYYAGAAPGPAFLAIPAYLLYRTVEPWIPVDLFSQYDKTKYIRGYLKGIEAPDAFVQAYPLGRFIVLHFLLTGLTCSAMAALMAVALFRFLKSMALNVRWAYGIAFAFAFGTTIFYYATRLYAHVLGSGFVFFAFLLLLMPKIRLQFLSPRAIFWSGFCLGTSVLMDYTVFPAAGIVGLYLLWTVRDRRIGYGIAGGMLPLILLMSYHAHCFGSPFHTAYGLPNGPVDDGTHVHYNENFHGFALPPLTQMWGLSFSLFRGVFWYIPVTFCCLFGLVRMLKSDSPFRVEWQVVGAILLGQFLFNAMMHPDYWYGGWEFGPRFLTPMIPFMFLPLCGLVNWDRFSRTVTLYLIILSVLINWIGTLYGPSHSLIGMIALFMLSGPSTPLFSFLKDYFQTYTTWDVTVSPWGGFLLVGLFIYLLWRVPVVSPVKE